MLFRNRTEAGQVLAARLMKYADRPDVLVLALPRGGVPVAYEVARSLHAPLDVFLVRKLGMPGHRELAIGAIATGDVRVLNEDAIGRLHVSDEVIESVVEKERKELERRERAYRHSRTPLEIRNRTVLLIDDGLATGSSMRAAVMALRRREPDHIVVAVPVGASETCSDLGAEAEEVICAETPDPFHAVGIWYGDFKQTTDEEVRELLDRSFEEYNSAVQKT